MSTPAQSSRSVSSPPMDGFFIGRMAESLGDNARATTIFAPPVEGDGVMVIPVARARWGFGAGTGRQHEGEEGAGGGGGMVVSPVGYIELRKGQARYRSITNRMLLIPALLVLGAAVLMTVKDMARE